MKHALAALLSLFLLLSALGAAAETPSVLGQPFPDFTITDTEGNEITLNQGKTFVEIVRESDASKVVISDDPSISSSVIDNL